MWITPYSPRVRVGTPSHPDPSLYEHLTEKQRMQSGWPNRPMDQELYDERINAQKLCEQFNAIAPGDEEGLREVLKQLLHPSCRDKKVVIKQPTQIDYGYFLKVKFLSIFGTREIRGKS
jgi:hypothetical protein